MIFAKALVAPIVTGLILALEFFGVTPDMTVEQALTVIISGALTTALVYFVPNKK